MVGAGITAIIDTFSPITVALAFIDRERIDLDTSSECAGSWEPSALQTLTLHPTAHERTGRGS
jgi:hypothetical protein